MANWEGSSFLFFPLILSSFPYDGYGDATPHHFIEHHSRVPFAELNYPIIVLKL